MATSTGTSTATQAGCPFANTSFMKAIPTQTYDPVANKATDSNEVETTTNAHGHIVTGAPNLPPSSTSHPHYLTPSDKLARADLRGAPPDQYLHSCYTSNGGQPLTPLQSHILFWDRDADGVIWPGDVYRGFRALGFSIPFSILSFLIPVYFSYPTSLGHTLLPDPLFRIHVRGIHKAKHGSDTGTYDLDGECRRDRFEAMWKRFDTSGKGLDVLDVWRLLAKDRLAMDLMGWTFAFMEWSTTWLLLADFGDGRGGRVQKEDLWDVYEGSLFWRIGAMVQAESEGRGEGWTKGAGPGRVLGVGWGLVWDWWVGDLGRVKAE